MASAARYSVEHRVPVPVALEQLHASAHAHVARRRSLLDARPTRRGFLASVGAASLVGPTLLGRRAFAKKPSASAARVAVIGAGVGGLACADALAGAGVDVTVFEASSRAGGRIASIGGAFPGAIALPGQVSELGGEFVDTLHTTIRGYATAFGLDTEDVIHEVDGDAVFDIGGVSYGEVDVVDAFADLVTAMSADLRDLSNEVTPERFTAADEVLDRTDLDTYLVTRGADPLIRDVVRESYRNEYGRDVSEQSSLNFLFMIHADRRSNWQPWGVFSDERFHVIGGNQQIPQRLAEGLGTRISWGHRLEAARRLGSGVYRLTFAVDGGPVVDLDFDYVVFAVPFTVLRTLALDATLGLPAWKSTVIDTLQYGTNSKMILGFDGRPWADRGLSGELFSYGRADLSSGWESNPTLATPSSAVYVDYSGGARGAGMNEADPAGEAERWLAAFDAVIPGATAAVRRDGGGAPVATVKNWSTDPNQLAAYTCNQPGYFTTLANTEATRIDNLLFAGEHTSSFYDFQGWMEGAAVSGLDAADAVLADLRSPH